MSQTICQLLLRSGVTTQLITRKQIFPNLDIASLGHVLSESRLFKFV